jgi:hypothetical protein
MGLAGLTTRGIGKRINGPILAIGSEDASASRGFLGLAILVLAIANPLALHAAKAKPALDGVIWVDPGDIKARNLYFGVGGESNQPKPPVKFVKEDVNGTSPKFDVHDESHQKWKAKLGIEAQPETVASRLLWAVGYFANENYYFPTLKVKDLPRLRRGQEFVVADGEVRGVRLQQHLGDEKKGGTWSWHHSTFAGTREFNGLRVMMALLNNWDLKDENNAVFDDPDHAGKKIYEVTDVGASFGPAGESYSNRKSKASIPSYRTAKFISKVTRDHVDFNFPTHLPFLYVFNAPHFFSELHNRSIGKHIPRADAHWIGSLLAQLSHEQIRDAFRAGGYSASDVEAYSEIVEKRIAALTAL